jgi:hypothetical protein
VQGSGNRLFPDTVPIAKLGLVGAPKSCKSGITLLRYAQE